MTEKNETFATKSVISLIMGNGSSMVINTKKEFAQWFYLLKNPFSKARVLSHQLSKYYLEAQFHSSYLLEYLDWES